MWLLAAMGVLAQQAPIPHADELSGQPYAIRNKWVIGGSGDWDYLTLDPAAGQLFITHQTEVQVVDVARGLVLGSITGFGEARSIVLDPDGQFGYVSDSRSHEIKIFDRRSLKIEASIPLDCAPRSLALAAGQGILIAVCSSPVRAAAAESRPRPSSRRSLPGRPVTRVAAKGDSSIIVIDTDARAVLVYLFVAGDLHIAQPDGEGDVYVTVGPAQRDADRLLGTYSSVAEQSVARVDVPALVEDARAALAQRGHPAPSAAFPAPHWDAGEADRSRYIRLFPLDSSCPEPQGLAVDSRNARLFVGCDNQVMIVMDSNRGQVLSTLTTGPGTDAVAYDAGRGLIFTANGGGYGSVTIIRQHETDSYAVIQNLPTLEQARTMAIDPSTGLLYLVTTLHGADLRHPPANGIGTLKMNPINGSFQVLVVGN